MATIQTPEGRFVQGDLFKAQQRRDANGKGRVIEAGKPNAGQPDMQHFVAIAIPKTSPDWTAFHAVLVASARAAWPQFFDAQGNCTRPDFAWKITDGDGRTTKGIDNSKKEGFPGCWIVKAASNFAPKVYSWNNGWVEALPGAAKIGDHGRIGVSIASNQSSQTPGMYVNLDMIAVSREGTAIVQGPAPDDVFTAPGAAGAPAGTATPPPAGAAAPAPYAGYMGGADAAPPPPPAPAAGPVMTAKAGATPYASFISQGWTDETLRQHGYIQ